MADYNLEDTVLLLDASRSMMISDYKPRRVHAMVKMAWQFCKAKFEIDPQDRIAIVTFGKRARKVVDFTGDLEMLRKALTRLEISGKGNVEEGISLSIQLLAKEIQKIGGKVQRVFLVTDDRAKGNLERLMKVAGVAKGLGIFLDVAVLRNLENTKSPFRDAARSTGGEFGYFKTPKALVNAGRAFASKKNVGEEEIFSLTQKQKEAPKFLKEIAVNLRRPGIGELKLLVGGQRQEQCQICFQNKCPVCSSGFFSCGRYCPNCGQPLHLHCSAMWAQRSPELGETVFRCPHCYFLVKVPRNIVTMLKHKHAHDPKKAATVDQTQPVHMVEVPDDQVPSIEGSCSWCNSVFLGDLKVFRCDHCGAHYHLPCLEEMFAQIRACRNCGRLIQ